MYKIYFLKLAAHMRHKKNNNAEEKMGKSYVP